MVLEATHLILAAFDPRSRFYSTQLYRNPSHSLQTLLPYFLLQQCYRNLPSRCFDWTPDWRAAMLTACNLGFNTILTRYGRLVAPVYRILIFKMFFHLYLSEQSIIIAYLHLTAASVFPSLYSVVHFLRKSIINKYRTHPIP